MICFTFIVHKLWVVRRTHRCPGICWTWKNETFLVPSIGSHWSAFFLFPFCFWWCWTWVYTHCIRIVPYWFLLQTGHLLDTVSNIHNWWPYSMWLDAEQNSGHCIQKYYVILKRFLLEDVHFPCSSVRFQLIAKLAFVNWTIKSDYDHGIKRQDSNSCLFELNGLFKPRRSFNDFIEAVVKAFLSNLMILL